MILLILMALTIILLVYSIYKTKLEHFMGCPDNYSNLCAQQSHDSLSKAWCILSSADVECSETDNNFIQPQCLNSKSLTAQDSYQTNANAWCTQPKEEYYY